MRHTEKFSFISNNIGISTQLLQDNSAPLHDHEFYEIFYVLSGEIHHVINGKEETLVAGDLRILSPVDVHDIRFNKASTHRDILIDVELFERFCAAVFPTVDYIKNKLFAVDVKLSNTDIIEIESFLRNFSLEPNIDIKRCNALQAVLKILAKTNLSEVINEQPEDYPPIINRILTNLNKPMYLKKNISDIITGTGYNASYISRLFKKHLGVTISDYIKDVRLLHVAYYLKATDLTIRQIADTVGIESLSYLNNIFKKKYSVPPNKYRKNHQQK